LTPNFNHFDSVGDFITTHPINPTISTWTILTTLVTVNIWKFFYISFAGFVICVFFPSILTISYGVQTCYRIFSRFRPVGAGHPPSKVPICKIIALPVVVALTCSTFNRRFGAELFTTLFVMVYPADATLILSCYFATATGSAYVNTFFKSFWI